MSQGLVTGQPTAQGLVNLPCRLHNAGIVQRMNAARPLLGGGDRLENHDMAPYVPSFMSRKDAAQMSNASGGTDHPIPVFQSLSGLGRMPDFNDGMTQSERNFLLVRACKEVQRDLAFVGLPIAPVKASINNENNPQVTLSGKGMARMPSDIQPWYTGQMLQYYVGSQGILAGGGGAVQGRHFARVRPVSPTLWADRGRFWQELFFNTQGEQRHYRGAMALYSDSTPVRDEFDALRCMENGLWHAGGSLAATAMRRLLRGLLLSRVAVASADDDEDASEEDKKASDLAEAKSIGTFAALGKIFDAEKASRAEADAAITEAVNSVLRSLMTDAGMVGRQSGDKQHELREVISVDMIHPSKATDASNRKKQINSLARLGMFTDAPLADNESRLYDLAADTKSRLPRDRQLNGFADLVAGITTINHDESSTIFAKAMSSASAHSEGTVLLMG